MLTINCKTILCSVGFLRSNADSEPDKDQNSSLFPTKALITVFICRFKSSGSYHKRYRKIQVKHLFLWILYPEQNCSEKQDCEFEEGNNDSNWSRGTPQLVRRFACCTLYYLGHPIIPFFTLLMSVGSNVPMSSSIDSRPMSARAAAPTCFVTAARHAAPNTAAELCTSTVRSTASTSCQLEYG